MKKKTRAATAAELEAILEQLMLEVANSYPVWEYINSGDSEPSVKNWAHMTAMYVSEVLKRRSSDRDTIIKKAKKAVRRRIERELADSYLGVELPEWEEGVPSEPTGTESLPIRASGDAAGDASSPTVPEPTEE